MIPLPRVILVGRMNVGKSTLWNRLTETHGALISPIAGTTRDTREGIVEWRGTRVLLVDTGGIDIPHLRERPSKKKKRGAHGYPEESDPFAAAIERQTLRAVEGATLVVFVVDGKEGLVPQERVWARALLKSKKRTLLAVNKIDAGHHRDAIHTFWPIGLGEPFAVSAATGLGTGDLLDHIVTGIQRSPSPIAAHESKTDERPPIRIALVGRPNVGKSSLVNAILGEERVIVSSIPHTTREPIDTAFTADGAQFVLVDTAGMRKHARIAPGLERAGVTLTLNALARADIALFVVESNEPLGSQDMHIAETIVERRVGCVIIANKWDLYSAESGIRNQESGKRGDIIKNYTNYIRKHLPHLHWAPILFVSAVTKRNVQNILAAARMVMQERIRVIEENVLQAFIQKLVYRPSSKTKKIRTARVYGLRQTGTAPPEFTLVTEWTNVMTQRGKQKGTVRESYVRFVENRLREKFGFTGTPVVFTLRTIEH